MSIRSSPCGLFFLTDVDIGQLIGTFNVSRLTAARIVRDVSKPIAKADENTPDRGVIINTASVAAVSGIEIMCSSCGLRDVFHSLKGKPVKSAIRRAKVASWA